jgi:hypothetical protein
MGGILSMEVMLDLCDTTRRAMLSTVDRRQYILPQNRVNVISSAAKHFFPFIFTQAPEELLNLHCQYLLFHCKNKTQVDDLKILLVFKLSHV